MEPVPGFGIEFRAMVDRLLESEAGGKKPLRGSYSVRGWECPGRYQRPFGRKVAG